MFDSSATQIEIYASSRAKVESMQQSSHCLLIAVAHKHLGRCLSGLELTWYIVEYVVSWSVSS